MFEASTSIGWGGALLWLAGIAGGAFVISWVLSDLLRVRRAPYVGALALLTGGLIAGYLMWSGSGADFWLEGWPWGMLAAALAGAFLAVLISRVELARPAARLDGPTSLWEGLVYGSAEGLLLSVLPVLAAWQAFAALGWTDGWRGIVAGAGAIGASIAVIVVHHLGYPQYRGRAIVSPVIGCTVLSIAYLVTASPIAAMGGHIALHLAMLRRGMELPPHAGPGPILEEVAPAEQPAALARAG